MIKRTYLAYGALLSWLLFSLPSSGGAAIEINEHDAQAIAQKIWKNECNGTIDGLTSWNTGENFASLGICHFIWYPAGEIKKFEESFPVLVLYFAQNRVQLPFWLQPGTPCPWKNREQFLAATKDPTDQKMMDLKKLLAATVGLQSRFAVLRLEQALPKMVKAVDPKSVEKIKFQFDRISQVRNGLYALVDYVNFKGEGTKLTERYNGVGWGLLQVLEQMKGEATISATTEFANAAEIVLRRRVENAPPERHEERWLAGWLSRVKTYRPANL